MGGRRIDWGAPAAPMPCALLNGRWGAPYLLAQVATTGIVMLWSFTANRWWTFRGYPEVPPAPP